MSTGHYSDPENDHKIFVFTQSADGTLGAPQKLADNGATISSGDPLRAVDIDGDGDVDLVRGMTAGVDVAMNDGNGLTSPVLHPFDGPTRGIQVADLDGAPPTELVVQGETVLHVLRWDDGQLTDQALDFAAPASGTGVGIGYDVADLTGDDRPDIANFSGDDIAVHAQQPDGSWAAPTSIDMPGFEGLTLARTLTTGDIDDDGRADLVAVGYGNSSTPRLVYREQLASGGFGPAVVLATADAGPGSVRIADVTADGRADVVVLHNGGTAGVYAQTAAGALAQEQLLGGFYATWHHSPDAMSVGDLDSDGVNDVAVGSYNYGLYVHRHTSADSEGAGPWVAGSAPAEHATGVAASVRPTVTFGRAIDPGSVVAGETVWLIDGRNSRAVDITVSMSGRTMTVRPRVALTPGAPYQIWIAGVTSGGGTQSAYERIPFTVAAGAAPSYSVNGTYLPFRVDLDGNGYDEMFWYGPGSAADSVWFFGPDGRTNVTAAVNGTYTPVASDFDGNGYEDVFWYGPGSATDVMWRNGRDGIVAVAMPVNGTYVPVAGDFDGNGYDDVLWYGPGAVPDSVWYFGPSGRTVVAKRVTGTTYRPVSGDFNRDGFDDVVWYAPGASGEVLWRGSRTGFTSVATMSITITYRGKALDFNADGFDEVYLYTTNRGVFWRSGPNGFTSTQNGPPLAAGGRPVAGEFTGDGRDDLFNYVPGTAADRFYRGTATGVA